MEVGLRPLAKKNLGHSLNRGKKNSSEAPLSGNFRNEWRLKAGDMGPARSEVKKNSARNQNRISRKL